MNWPFFGPPPAILVWPMVMTRWSIDPRGLANSLNPIDHPWNFDSATVAKHRLRAVTRADRQACGDGTWVKVRGRGIGVPWTCYISQNPVVKDLIRHWEREDKPRYRWERRR